jgi:hypothetical protein
MPQVDNSKYDILLRNEEKDSYEGKILKRSLSDRLLSSPKITSFLVNVEPIIYNWFNSTRLIKKQLNFRIKQDSKSIDK